MPTKAAVWRVIQHEIEAVIPSEGEREGEVDAMVGMSRELYSANGCQGSSPDRSEWTVHLESIVGTSRR